MDKITNTSKIIGAAVIVIIIVFAMYFYYGGKSQAPTQSNSVTTAATPSGASNTSTTNTANGLAVATATIPGATSDGKQPSAVSGAKRAKPYIPPPVIIHLVTPVANDVWTIGASNPISWTNAANFTGEIDLLDAKTGKSIGVILSQTDPNQTSYAWNTREYSLSRYNALEKQVTPGTYQIELKFDGNNLPPVTSAVITITN